MFYQGVLFGVEWKFIPCDQQIKAGQNVMRNDAIVVHVYARGTSICFLTSVCVLIIFSFAKAKAERV